MLCLKVGIQQVNSFITIFSQKEIKDTKLDLEKTLKQASSKRAFVLVLDSLDQLDPEHGARQLTWLVSKLPPHVKVILSTLPEEKYQCLPKLKVTYMFIPRQGGVYSDRLHLSICLAVCVSASVHLSSCLSVCL